MAQIFPIRREKTGGRRFPRSRKDPAVSSGKSGSGPDALRFAPYDLNTGRERYIECYRDAWQIAHGTMKGFPGDVCWRMAVYRAGRDPEALTAARLGNEFAGVLALDFQRDAREGRGWIAFCYVVPELRGRGFGLALTDRAGEIFRGRGRSAMRLTVAPANPALGFYRKAGFVDAGREAGALEDLIVMEKPL